MIGSVKIVCTGEDLIQVPACQTWDFAKDTRRVFWQCQMEPMMTLLHIGPRQLKMIAVVSSNVRRNEHRILR